MKINENRIRADVGKLLRRKSDGLICGRELHLGFTYYIEGKKLDTPLQELPDHFEEIDDPDFNSQEPVTLTRAELNAMLKRNETLSAFAAMSINTMALDEETALDLKDIYPRWSDLWGCTVAPGFRLRYEGVLYEVVARHTIQSVWPPPGLLSLYKVVTSQPTAEAGTIADPIQWVSGMELEQGKYYTDAGIMYRCTTAPGMPLAFPLAELVGLYVTVVN